MNDKALVVFQDKKIRRIWYKDVISQHNFLNLVEKKKLQQNKGDT